MRGFVPDPRKCIADNSSGMNRGIYATATGMLGAQRQLDVLAHNLANAATSGYKRDGVAFADVFVRELYADGGMGERLGSIGSGPTLTQQFTVMERGPLTHTGNGLDVAIEDTNCMFAVQTKEGVRYTRNGALQLNSAGELVDGRGNAVLDDRMQPITVDGAPVQIQPNGEIVANERVLGRIGIFRGTFSKVGENLFESTDARPDADCRLVPNSLEGSNVNPVQEMIGMIEVSRAFEMAQRSIVQQDELTKTLIQSLNG